MHNLRNDFRPRTPTSRVHVGVTISLVMLAVTLAFILDHMKSVHDEGICYTKECVSAAHDILSFMNESADPCDNFYEFMCGNYKANLLHSNGIYTSRLFDFENVRHHMLTQHLDDDVEIQLPRSFRAKRLFYRDCLDLKKIEENSKRTLSNDLNFVMGGWPLEDFQMEVNITWSEMMVRARHAGTKYDFFFNVNVFYHNMTKRFQIEISPPSEEYITGSVFTNIFKRDNIHNILEMAKYMSNNAMEKTNSLDLLNVVAFAKNLSNTVLESNRLYQSDGYIFRLVRIYQISQFVGDFNIDWLGFLRRFTGIETLQYDDKVELTFSTQRYLQELYNLMMKTPVYTMLHYVALTLIYDDCPYLSSALRHLCMSVLPNLVGNRRVICSAAIDRFDADEHSIDVEYVRRMNNPVIKEHAQEMFVSVKNAVLRNLSARKFSETCIFNSISAFYRGIKTALGWNELVFNASEYEKYYTFKTNYIDRDNSVLETRRWLEKSLLDNRFKAVKNIYFNVWDDRLKVPIVDFNAFFDDYEGIIYIQAPLLLEPTYGINRPQSLNYGTLGYIMGHEFMQGMEPNTDAQIEKWKYVDRERKINPWRNNMEHVRKEEEKCVLDAFHDKQAKSLGILNLKGPKEEIDRILYETLNDMGGFKFAYAAYENYTKHHWREEKMLPGLKYTPHQLFWIMSGSFMCERGSVEQTHPRHSYRNYYYERRFQADSFRVNAARMNNPDFLKAFQCKPGDRMYPKHSKTCDITI